MTTEIYPVGSLVSVYGTFRNNIGALADPTNVYFELTNPAGTTVVLHYGVDPVIKDSTGVYHINVDANAVGLYQYHIYATGTGQAATFGAFNVYEGVR